MHPVDKVYIRNWFDILGVYQVLGGVVGIIRFIFPLVGMFFSGVSDILPNAAIVTIFVWSIAALTFFGWSIYSGMCLLGKKNKGLKYSRINQYLQLVNFHASGILFNYVSGVSICMGLNLTDGVGLNFDAGFSNITFLFFGEKNIAIINFNFIALIALVMIDSLSKMIADDEAKLQIEQIGKE